MIRCNRLALFTAALIAMAGCGRTGSSVKGVVTLDGNPVEGATVEFLSEDGSQTYSGFTDASGGFSLTSADQKTGVPPGTYKVVVVKRPAIKGSGETMVPGSPDYLKMVEKEAKDAPRPKIGMPPGMPMGKMAGARGPKSDLPAIYASKDTTPISVKVPPDTQPVPIDLKGKS